MGGKKFEGMDYEEVMRKGYYTAKGAVNYLSGFAVMLLVFYLLGHYLVVGAVTAYRKVTGWEEPKPSIICYHIGTNVVLRVGSK